MANDGSQSGVIVNSWSRITFRLLRAQRERGFRSAINCVGSRPVNRVAPKLHIPQAGALRGRQPLQMGVWRSVGAADRSPGGRLSPSKQPSRIDPRGSFGNNYFFRFFFLFSFSRLRFSLMALRSASETPVFGGPILYPCMRALAN
jgi:hypothetical protein